MLQIVSTMLTNKYSCSTCSSKLNNLDMRAYYHHYLFIIFISSIIIIADTSIMV